MSEIGKKIDVRVRDELFINVDPIQVGGRLTNAAMKALIAYGDGYSICDYCRKPFRLDKICKPPLQKFHENLASFVGMGHARVVPGARRGFQAVTLSMLNKDDIVLLSSLGHYTEFLAIESAGARAKEIPADKNNIITAEATHEKIEEVKKESKLPKLIMIDHVDYKLGNMHEIEDIAKVAHDYDIPILYNGAYTVGIMPVDGKKLGVDFVVGSGHKSFASPAPSGILAITDEYRDRVFETTKIQGDITKRKFGIKEIQMMGCTLMGSNVVAMMASFPEVKVRVQNWDEEIKKTNYFADQFLRVEGSKILSEMPRKHTLSKVDTTDSFDKVAKTHKKRGYFLYRELKNRGIIGIFEGATKKWKLNTFGLTWDHIKHLSDSFLEIAEKYNLGIN